MATNLEFNRGNSSYALRGLNNKELQSAATLSGGKSTAIENRVQDVVPIPLPAHHPRELGPIGIEPRPRGRRGGLAFGSGMRQTGTWRGDFHGFAGSGKNLTGRPCRTQCGFQGPENCLAAAKPQRRRGKFAFREFSFGCARGIRGFFCQRSGNSPGPRPGPPGGRASAFRRR